MILILVVLIEKGITTDRLYFVYDQFIKLTSHRMISNLKVIFAIKYLLLWRKLNNSCENVWSYSKVFDVPFLIFEG